MRDNGHGGMIGVDLGKEFLDIGEQVALPDIDDEGREDNDARKGEALPQRGRHRVSKPQQCRHGRGWA